MTQRTRLTLLALLGTIVALAVGAHTPIGELIWPPAPLATEPTPLQTVGFIIASTWEAIGFGLGLALTVALYRPFQGLAHRSRLAWPAYASLAWLNLTWVVHDNLHIHVGESPLGLVRLELIFHTTLIAAGLIVGLFLLRSARATPAGPVRTPSATTVHAGVR